MHFVISFYSDHFDHSKEPINPINPIQGHTVATWFASELKNHAVVTSEVMPEDWGWFMDVTYQNQGYMLGFIAFEDDNKEKLPEIVVQILKQRTLRERLFGKNKLTQQDPLLCLIVETAKRLPDCRDLDISKVR